MLTEAQLEFISELSRGAGFGLVTGSICGLLVTAAILILRECKAGGDGNPFGLLYGLVPGGAAGAISAAFFFAVVAILEATYCERGAKGGYVVPLRVELFSTAAILFVSLLAAGIAARLAIPEVGARQKTWAQVIRSALAWGALGAFIGAIALVGPRFSGYFSRIVSGNHSRFRLRFCNHSMDH